MFLSRRRKTVNNQYTKNYAVLVGSVQPKTLVEMTIKELKELCKERGIKGYSSKSESELIGMLMDGEV